MISLRSVLFTIFLFFLFNKVSIAQEFFSCSGTGGIYGLFLINPNAMDGDDGNVDGNCEYTFRTTMFSSLNVAVYNYVGTGTATPTSVTHTRVPLMPGVITVLAPCGNLDIAFDITEANSNPLCMIRNNFMPVELSIFQAKSIKNGIQLNWKTASELNNLGFEVERSADSKIWKKIAFVEGHLTTIENQNYELIDHSPLQGFAYYRLKQIDTDRQFEYSEIIVVKHYDEKGFSVAPNPAIDQIYIDLPGYQEAEVLFFNYLGKLVKQIRSSHNSFNIRDLQKGIYVLIIKTNHQTYTTQFIKK